MALRGFVVRPFGKRVCTPQGGQPCEADFEAIHRELIMPALDRAGISGDTTQQVLYAGNIHEDMFQLLAHADIVIADVSLHNANVFYELGIRHALRQRHTFMIRFPSTDDVPFDIHGGRYLTYDLANPAASVQALSAGLQATLINVERTDSPVFNMLPTLRPPDRKYLVPVPVDFLSELQRAMDGRRVSHLVLLRDEVSDLAWGSEGLRQVARALGSLNAKVESRDAWKAVAARDKLDLECAIELAKLHQRLDDPAASEEALKSVLANPSLRDEQKAIALALRGGTARVKVVVASFMQPAAACLLFLPSSVR